MSIAMHFSQVLTVFWLVVAASQYGKAIDVDLAKGLAGTAAAAGLAGTAAAAGLAGTAAAAGLAKAGLATAALADAGAAGIAGAAGAGGLAGAALEAKKALLVKAALIKLIKAKLAANVADKTWSIAGEKILKGLLIKLGLVSAGVAADAFIKKLAFVKDAELLPLLLTAGLLDERGWIPDAYVKDGVSFWGQLLPNFSEASIVKLLGNIVY
ncbi:unnamed protein product [Acanthoscelides obtectus]|uniref:Uncharacterized protein n=1 Tax=Acanthoscelides obtectus TaxID=200917 RepID=A0A9P0JRT7_ACAOB|nr:unnamed protein product [Acanthoscelides obtectus]CAK1679398.1 hypothetical protein AOBTE_LOCUS32231 [Acanthoscelides obtectus]